MLRIHKTIRIRVIGRINDQHHEIAQVRSAVSYGNPTTNLPIPNLETLTDATVLRLYNQQMRH